MGEFVDIRFIVASSVDKGNAQNHLRFERVISGAAGDTIVAL